MTCAELDSIRQWDAKCGNNETTFFPVTKDRRRLIEHVDELRDLLRLCRDCSEISGNVGLVKRIDAALNA
jgi:hypothetical protein